MSSDIHSNYQAIAAGLDDVLNGENCPPEKRKFAFGLLVAEFGKVDGGRVNYISNADREGMLALMREYLARAEGRAPQAPSRMQ